MKQVGTNLLCSPLIIEISHHVSATQIIDKLSPSIWPATSQGFCLYTRACLVLTQSQKHHTLSTVLQSVWIWLFTSLPLCSVLLSSLCGIKTVINRHLVLIISNHRLRNQKTQIPSSAVTTHLVVFATVLNVWLHVIYTHTHIGEFAPVCVCVCVYGLGLAGLLSISTVMTSQRHKFNTRNLSIDMKVILLLLSLSHTHTHTRTHTLTSVHTPNSLESSKQMHKPVCDPSYSREHLEAITTPESNTSPSLSSLFLSGLLKINLVWCLWWRDGVIREMCDRAWERGLQGVMTQLRVTWLDYESWLRVHACRCVSNMYTKTEGGRVLCSIKEYVNMLVWFKSV